jgi:acyl-CoA synthetase (AMP-forming)/AMP-acid ligase II
MGHKRSARADRPDPFLSQRIGGLAGAHPSGVRAPIRHQDHRDHGPDRDFGPSFSNPADPAARKFGSVGRASGCEARVLDPQAQEVPNGVSGELAVRGPNVMVGYHKNESATRAAFTPDGWLRTGDLGHRDADGIFFVTGRLKELIIKGGENIAPREIDDVLLRHPCVLDAAAVGCPHPHYGQDIMVCVVLREPALCTQAELHAYCLEHLGAFKTPSVWRFVRELPRGPSGKVQRLKLLDPAHRPAAAARA